MCRLYYWFWMRQLSHEHHSTVTVTLALSNPCWPAWECRNHFFWSWWRRNILIVSWSVSASEWPSLAFDIITKYSSSTGSTSDFEWHVGTIKLNQLGCVCYEMTSFLRLFSLCLTVWMSYVTRNVVETVFLQLHYLGGLWKPDVAITDKLSRWPPIRDSRQVELKGYC